MKSLDEIMLSTEMEIWKPIPEFEQYYLCSNIGQIKNIRTNKLLSQYKNRYCNVTLSKDKVHIPMGVHRIVAMTFLENLNNKPYVNHKDGNRYNNNVSNLEWVTAKENSEHAISTGLHKIKGVEHPLNKLSEENVLFIFNSELICKKLAEMFNISPSTCASIKSGRLWNHLTKKEIEPCSFSKEKILEIFNCKGSYRQICKKLNVSYETVYQVKSGKRHSDITGKVYIKKSNDRGLSSHLTDDDVLEIFHSTDFHKNIAQRFNIHKSSVCKIKYGETYSNVTGKYKHHEKSK